MVAFDPILLARIQFAFTVSFHIIFPAFTIGLASFLAVIEALWLRTGQKWYPEIYLFWVKIFAIAFGMGVVSGVVLSYQFGTNWSLFSDRTANVLGPLLSFEVLTAFFLEASFLGIMLFGERRVSRTIHFLSTCIVAGGTLISAFWILSANSWMQTPQGFVLDAEGRFMPTNWLEIIFNPSFPYRFLHMVTAAYLSTAFVIGGVGGFYLWRHRHEPHARVMLSMAVLMAVFVAPLQGLIGHQHGINTMIYQPAKIAAIEGNWDHTTYAPLYLFGWPNSKTEKTEYSLQIPNGASWILTGQAAGKIPNLKSFKPQDRPPVAAVFWSFRVMVGIGLLMIALGGLSAFYYVRNRLYTTPWIHISWMMMMPSGFIALLAGWFVTEIGRQPYVAYGILRTKESVSPAILGPQVAWSLVTFIIIYTFVFGAALYYIVKLIRKGIISDSLPPSETDMYYGHSLESSAFKSGPEQRETHV